MKKKNPLIDCRTYACAYTLGFASSLVVSKVMYMLKHLWKQHLKLETLAAPNSVPILYSQLISSPSHHFTSTYVKELIFYIKSLCLQWEGKIRLSSRFSDPLKDLYLYSFLFINKDITLTNIHLLQLTYQDPLKITS